VALTFLPFHTRSEEFVLLCPPKNGQTLWSFGLQGVVAKVTPGDERNVAFGHDWLLQLLDSLVAFFMDLDGNFSRSRVSGLGHRTQD
jgi:hypothetical protein